MSSAEFSLPLNVTNFTPGSELSGSVTWKLDNKPDVLEVVLAWRISGMGLEELTNVSKFDLKTLSQQGQASFNIAIPELVPASLKGPLFNLQWLLIFNAEPGFIEELPIVISPTSEIYTITEVPKVTLKDRIVIRS